MKGQIYVTKKYSEKKAKSYTTAILKIADSEIMINLDRYYMMLLSKVNSPLEFESLEVGYKSAPIEFDI